MDSREVAKAIFEELTREDGDVEAAADAVEGLTKEAAFVYNLVATAPGSIGLSPLSLAIGQNNERAFQLLYDLMFDSRGPIQGKPNVEDFRMALGADPKYLRWLAERAGDLTWTGEPENEPETLWEDVFFGPTHAQILLDAGINFTLDSLLGVVLNVRAGGPFLRTLNVMLEFVPKMGFRRPVAWDIWNEMRLNVEDPDPVGSDLVRVLTMNDLGLAAIRRDPRTRADFLRQRFVREGLTVYGDDLVEAHRQYRLKKDEVLGPLKMFQMEERRLARSVEGGPPQPEAAWIRSRALYDVAPSLWSYIKDPSKSFEERGKEDLSLEAIAEARWKDEQENYPSIKAADSLFENELEAFRSFLDEIQ